MRCIALLPASTVVVCSRTARRRAGQRWNFSSKGRKSFHSARDVKQPLKAQPTQAQVVASSQTWTLRGRNKDFQHSVQNSNDTLAPTESLIPDLLQPCRKNHKQAALFLWLHIVDAESSERRARQQPISKASFPTGSK